MQGHKSGAGKLLLSSTMHSLVATNIIYQHCLSRKKFTCLQSDDTVCGKCYQCTAEEEVVGKEVNLLCKIYLLRALQNTDGCLAMITAFSGFQRVVAAASYILKGAMSHDE